jgi:hypothetical protein
MPFKNLISGFRPLGPIFGSCIFPLFYISWSQFFLSILVVFRPVQCQILLRGDAECAKRERKRSRRGGAGRLRQRGGQVVRAAHCRVPKCAQYIPHAHSVICMRTAHSVYAKQIPNAVVMYTVSDSKYTKYKNYDRGYSNKLPLSYV